MQNTSWWCRRSAWAVSPTRLALPTWIPGASDHLVAMRRSPTSPYNLTGLAQVRRLMRRYRPGVVHGHSLIGGVLARVAAMDTGTPRVYTLNALFPG